MQVKRNKRYAIHYPMGAGGDFFTVCLYLLNDKIPSGDWREHTRIDENGKIWPSSPYQLESKSITDNQTFPIFKNSDPNDETKFYIEDYITLKKITSRKTVDFSSVLDLFNQPVNSEDKIIEVAKVHHFYSMSKISTRLLPDWEKWWDKSFDFDNQFYIHFDCLDDVIISYIKFIIKDHDNLDTNLFSSNEVLVNTYIYFENVLRVQEKLKRKKYIGIPFSILDKPNPITISKFVYKNLGEATINEEFIDFVSTYSNVNRNNEVKIQDNLYKIKSKVRDSIKSFEKIIETSLRK